MKLAGAGRYSSKVQQRPLTVTSTSYHPRPALAGTADKRPAAPLVRDEEAAGSNPATPTGKRQVTRHLVACRLHYAFPDVRFSEPVVSGTGNRGPLGPCSGPFLALPVAASRLGMICPELSGQRICG